SFNLQFQPGILRRFRSVVAECADDGTILLVFREAVKQTLYATWGKKTDHIVFGLCQEVFYIITLGTIHKCQCVLTIVALKPVHNFVILLVFGTYIQKLFIPLMLVDDIEHALVCTICAVKNLAFSIENKFLKIKRHRFCDAEILGILRNADLHFLAGTKEMIDGVAAGKDHTGVILNLYFLFAKVPGGYAF